MIGRGQQFIISVGAITGLSSDMLEINASNSPSIWSDLYKYVIDMDICKIVEWRKPINMYQPEEVIEIYKLNAEECWVS